VKFKLIFLLFNILILISFTVVLVMPVIILGSGYSLKLWSSTWYLPALFGLIILGIDGYFFMNWRLFTLLESENWSDLMSFLEERIFRKGEMRTSYVRTLIQTYFVRGRVKDIEPLEKLLREKKPALVRKFALELGMPKVLHKDHADMVVFFGEFADQQVPHKQWIRFFHAFGVLMQQEHAEGREELLSLSKDVREPVLQALILYTLDPFRTLDSEVLEYVDEQKERIRTKYSRTDLDKELSSRRENIAIVIMTPLIKDALNWLFPGDEE